MFKRFAFGAALAVATATAAQAGVVIDGSLDDAYGARTAHVYYSASAPDSNFGSPTNESHYQAYDIYLYGGAGYVYGLVQADGPSGLTFANLYFDLDYGSSSGSDLGFELSTGAGNQRMFVPNFWFNPAAVLPDVQIAKSADGSTLEFAIPVKYFTTQIAALTYDAGVQMPVIGDKVRLNLSQSFGYSVAGGVEYYGDDRLGTVSLTPEPASWAMMILGFGAAGGMIRRRRAVAV